MARSAAALTLAIVLACGVGCVSAQNCTQVCTPSYYNSGASDTFNSQCYYNCLTCYSWNNCYRAYSADFSGNTFISWSCWCYIPWWGWLLIGLGIFTCFALCFGCVFYSMQMRKRQHAAAMNAYDAQQKAAAEAAQAAAAQGAPPAYGQAPPAYGQAPPPPPPAY